MCKNIDIVRSAMFGHAIADAMGVPVEFQDRSKLRKNPVTGYRGYGSHGVPAGTWSDDTSMALATLDSLAQGLDYTDIMKRFCDWKLHAAYTATDKVFDIGITTNIALSNYLNGMPALECGCSGEYDNGNGSLMRIIPAALYCKYALGSHTLDEQLTVIHSISALTHAHPRSLIGCGIYSLILMELCDGKGKDGIQEGIQKAWQYYESKSEYQQELQQYHRLLSDRSILDFARTPETEIKSSGYVVSTLEAAIWCVLNTNNYRDCVLKAVNLGDDTDTIAAVAGGLAGSLYGMDGIPKDWHERLIRKERIEELCKNFSGIEHLASSEKEIPALQKVVDLHCHIVPGVDDGSQSMEMSLQMIRMEYDQGVRDIACTSHSFSGMRAYRENLIRLQKEVTQRGLHISLYPGCEVDCNCDSPSSILRRLEEGVYFPLGNSSYLLLEFSPYNISEEIVSNTSEMLDLLSHSSIKTKRVVLAHVERYQALARDDAALGQLLDLGCLLQINAYSLEKESDITIKTFARRLLAEKKVSFLGSDAHRTNHRPPDMASGVRYVYDHCDVEYANAVCYENAKRLLTGAWG